MNLNCISQNELNLVQKASLSINFTWIHAFFPHKEILYASLYLQTALQAYKIYYRHLIKPEIWPNDSDFKNGGLGFEFAPFIWLFHLIIYVTLKMTPYSTGSAFLYKNNFPVDLLLMHVPSLSWLTRIFKSPSNFSMPFSMQSFQLPRSWGSFNVFQCFFSYTCILSVIKKWQIAVLPLSLIPTSCTDGGPSRLKTLWEENTSRQSASIPSASRQSA